MYLTKTAPSCTNVWNKFLNVSCKNWSKFKIERNFKISLIRTKQHYLGTSLCKIKQILLLWWTHARSFAESMHSCNHKIHSLLLSFFHRYKSFFGELNLKNLKLLLSLELHLKGYNVSQTFYLTFLTLWQGSTRWWRMRIS